MNWKSVLNKIIPVEIAVLIFLVLANIPFIMDYFLDMIDFSDVLLYVLLILLFVCVIIIVCTLVLLCMDVWKRKDLNLFHKILLTFAFFIFGIPAHLFYFYTIGRKEGGL